MKLLNIKCLIILILVVLTTTSIFAQRKGNAAVSSNLSKAELTNFKKKAYTRALELADLNSAATAVLDILSMNENETHWLDSLALIYLNQQNFVSSASLAQQVLDKSPDNLFMREISAYSLQGLGAAKQALDDYEKLYAANKNIQHGYQIATLQFNLGRHTECMNTLKEVEGHPEAAKSTVSLTYGNEQQKVPVAAAILNMKGVVSKELKDTEKAIQFFEAALAEFPEFALAKGNLEITKNPPKK